MPTVKQITLHWLLLAACGLPVFANAAPTARVKITFVEMSRADVRGLRVTPPLPGRIHNDLKDLEAAASRRHFHYGVTDGPTVSVGTGQTQTQGVANVTAIRVRAPRAYVRVRIVNPPDKHRQPTRVVAATHVYRSGETRLIAALSTPNGHYRYTFATVTVTP